VHVDAFVDQGHLMVGHRLVRVARPGAYPPVLHDEIARAIRARIYDKGRAERAHRAALGDDVERPLRVVLDTEERLPAKEMRLAPAGRERHPHMRVGVELDRRAVFERDRATLADPRRIARCWSWP
jgi:hypothetical protein